MRTIGRFILAAVIAVVTAALIAAAIYVPGFFDLYTPISQDIMAFLAGIFAPFPFACWQVILLLLILLGLYTLVRDLYKRKGFFFWLSGLVCTVCAFVFVFVAVWGLNHWGPGIAAHLNLDVGQYSVAQLEETTRYFAQKASEYAPQVQREPDTDMAVDFEAMGKTAGAAYKPLAQQYPFFDGSDAPVKSLLADEAFRYMGITGIFVCFTGESAVSAGTYNASLPYTMCHEAAHRLSVTAEDEANFCAFLACHGSDDVSFRYSGYYSALIHCYNALYKANKEAATEIWYSLDPLVVSDMRRANEHYNQYEGKVQDAATKVNDTYLKAFGQEEGVRSYGKAADLLIAWYLAQ